MTSLSLLIAILLVFSARVRGIGERLALSSPSTNKLPQCKFEAPGWKPKNVERQRTRCPICSIEYLGCVEYLSEERIHANVSAQEMCYMNEIVELALDTGKGIVAIARSSNCGKVFMYKELPKSLKAKLNKRGGNELEKDGSCGLCCGTRSGLPCGKETIIGSNGKYTFIEKLAIYRVADPCVASSHKDLHTVIGKGGEERYNLANIMSDRKRKCQRCSLPREPYIEPLLATGTTMLASMGFFVFIGLGAGVVFSLRFFYGVSKDRPLPKGASIKVGGRGVEVPIFPHMPQFSRMLHMTRILLEYLTLWLPIIICLGVGFVNSPYACNTIKFCLNSMHGPAFECTEHYVPMMPFLPRHLSSTPRNQNGGGGNWKGPTSLRNGIPRIVHQVVDYGRTAKKEFLVPKIVAPYIHSCAQTMNWEQRWWGIDTGRPIIVEIVKAIGLKPDEFMKTFNSTFPNYRYNMLRTAIIWKYGGFYVDTDVICLRSPEHLLDDAGVSYAMASEEKIEGAIFAARPKHPFNEHLFRILVERARIPTILQRAHGTGPEAFQHAIETYPEHMPKVKILEQRYIDVSQRMMDFRIETYPRRDQATIVHAHVGHWGWKFARKKINLIATSIPSVVAVTSSCVCLILRVIQKYVKAKKLK